MHPSATRRIADWLASEQARRLDDVALVDQLATRIAEVVPIGRLSISFRTMHPEVYVRNLLWSPTRGTVLVERMHDIVDKTSIATSSAWRRRSRPTTARSSS